MAEIRDRIATTHAGSLPRPDALADLIWARADGKSIDAGDLDRELEVAVNAVVQRQRDVGIDLVSDGEFGKPGFNTYIKDRFDGFGGACACEVDDLADYPALSQRLLPPDVMQHNTFSNCIGPVALRDRDAVCRDVDRLIRALGGEASRGFMGAVSPGQIAFNFPNQYYRSHEEYLAAVADVLAIEYKAITNSGLSLQIDSPDMAMAAHWRSVGSSVVDWQTHLPLSVEALNAALDGIPREQVRLHVCWGNYAGPHHKDTPFEQIVSHVLSARVGSLSTEGANARHEHEWHVWERVSLPDDMQLIVSTIDVSTNRVEHPRLVADRLVRVAKLVGKERVVAGTDCGFDPIVRYAQVDPEVVWLKLASLVEGAELASAELS